MATYQSDNDWAAVIKQLSGTVLGPLALKAGVHAYLEFRVGRWTVERTPQVLVQDLKLHPRSFRVPARGYSSVWITLILARDGKAPYVDRMKLPWRVTYVIPAHRKDEIVARFGDVDPVHTLSSALRKLARNVATHKKILRSGGRREHTQYVGSAPRPNESVETWYHQGKEGNATGSLYDPYLDQVINHYTSYSRTWTGTRTPGFWKLRKSQLPFNAHTVTIVRVSDLPYYQKWVGIPPWTNQWYSVWNRTTAYVAPFVPAYPSFNMVARNKAINKLVEHGQLEIAGNLAQDVVQLHQTTRLIVNTMTRITGSVNALRRGKFDKAVSYLVGGKTFQRSEGHLSKGKWQANVRLQEAFYQSPPRFSKSKSLAENWLELQYGWKPLLQDIDGSMRSLANLMAGSMNVREVHGNGNHKERAKGNLTGVAPVITDKIGEYSINTISTSKMVLRYSIDSRMQSFLAQTGFTNPLNLAWEIIPFSFVVDWFLPIGPWLSQATSWDGLTFLSGHETRVTKQTVTASVRFNKVPTGNTWQKYMLWGGYQREYVNVTRSNLVSWPYISPPQWKNPISETHAANALALLRAAFR